MYCKQLGCLPYLRNIARAMIKDQGPVIDCCHCILCIFCSLYFVESKVYMVALNVHIADITIRLKLKKAWESSKRLITLPYFLNFV